MKRVPIVIRHKKRPDLVVHGYALKDEITDQQFPFFAAQKFPIDEELYVTVSCNGYFDRKTYTVTLRNVHEQISSGRIMIDVPSEDAPFPARKFYRCFTNVLSVNEDRNLYKNNVQDDIDAALKALDQMTGTPAGESSGNGAAATAEPAFNMDAPFEILGADENDKSDAQIAAEKATADAAMASDIDLSLAEELSKAA